MYFSYFMYPCLSLYFAELPTLEMVVMEIPIDLRALALRGVLQEVDLPHLQDTGLENWTSTRIKPDSLMMKKERFCRISAVRARA